MQKQKEMLEWWDSAIADIGGHPLQSSVWGQARQHASGIAENYFVGRHGEVINWMARVEERRVVGLGRIAWVPRGPSVCTSYEWDHAIDELRQQLSLGGYILFAISPWRETPASVKAADLKPDSFVGRRTIQRTIWLDLKQGKDALWGQLNKQWRYGVGRAARFGVVVERADDHETVAEFFDLCVRVSQKKGFQLPASLPLMQRLLELGADGPVQALLFVARFEGRLGSGVFVLRCGSSLHYVWGGTDRQFSKQRVAEATQWAVVEWALQQGCTLYDLEGIDPVANPGTYHFKKKMGGCEVEMPGEIFVPLSRRGRVLAALLSRRQ